MKGHITTMLARIIRKGMISGIAIGILIMGAVACSDTPEQTAAPAQQPTSAPVSQSAPAPTQAPAAAAPVAPAPTTAVATPVPAAPAQPASSAAGPKEITSSAPFAPSSNGAIESDDAFILSRTGSVETLLRIDFDGQIKPLLAQSWSVSGDGAWEFNLREDVNFHDGAHFDGQSVVDAVNYIRGVPNPPRGFTADNIESVEAPTDYTVVVSTSEADVLLPSRFATPGTAILTPAAYLERGDAPPSPIGAGTGPFIIEDEISIESVRSVRNEDYWDGIANLDAGETFYAPDGLVRAAMLETGEVDFVRHLAISQLPIFEGNSDFNIHRSQQPRTVTLYVNNRNGPFADLNVRKAAQHAIDRSAIVESVLEGVGAPAVGPFAASEAWVNPDLAPYEYDPERSKALLAEAGYAEGEAQVALWTYPSRAEFPAMAVALHEMLNDGGFSTEIRLAPWGALVDDVFAGNFDAFLVSRGHLIDAYDPEGFLSADYTCASLDVSNYANYCNPKVDELIEQARPIADLQARYEIIRQIQQILHDDAANPFINYTEQIFAYGNHVMNWQPHMLEYYMMTTQLDIAN